MNVENFAEYAADGVRRLMQRQFDALVRRWDDRLQDLRESLEIKIAQASIEPAKGDPGLDGKDALEIVIQPDLDPAKSYPRGTFVTHRGGLLRSVRKTTPLSEAAGIEGAGWVVIVRGIDTAAVEYPGERTTRTVFTYTDGSTTVTEVRYPGLLDKGVFREGESYERGDGVTFAGSWWIAQVDAPETKPGTSADWRLAVKKGRDGRDVQK